MGCLKTFLYIVAVILFIAAAGLLIFGFLFILGSGATNQPTSFGTGVVLFIVGFVAVGLGFGAIWLARRQAAQANGSAVTYKIDLPANVSMDTIKCKSCGGALAPENIQMVAGTGGNLPLLPYHLPIDRRTQMVMP